MLRAESKRMCQRPRRNSCRRPCRRVAREDDASSVLASNIAFGAQCRTRRGNSRKRSQADSASTGAACGLAVAQQTKRESSQTVPARGTTRERGMWGTVARGRQNSDRRSHPCPISSSNPRAKLMLESLAISAAGAGIRGDPSGCGDSEAGQASKGGGRQDGPDAAAVCKAGSAGTPAPEKDGGSGPKERAGPDGDGRHAAAPGSPGEACCPSRAGNAGTAWGGNASGIPAAPQTPGSSERRNSTRARTTVSKP